VITIFPDWAPPKLVEYYQAIYKLPNIGLALEKERVYLEAILTHREMKSVWKMFYSKWKRYGCPQNKTSEFEKGAMAFSVFSAIKGAIAKTEIKSTTRSYDVIKYQEIARDARTLAVKIRQSSLNKSPFDWFSDKTVNAILGNDIKPEKADGFFSLIYDESEHHKKGGIYTRRIVKDLIGNDVLEYQQVAKNTKEFFKNQCITPTNPRLAEILIRVAGEADTIATHKETETRIAGNSKTTKVTMFIRALYPFLINYFGSPLYGTLAALCRVVLNDDSVGESTVKDALKGYKI